jgi:hypothetical protein
MDIMYWMEENKQTIHKEEMPILRMNCRATDPKRRRLVHRAEASVAAQV